MCPPEKSFVRRVFKRAIYGVLLAALCLLALVACARTQSDLRLAEQHHAEALRLLTESNFQAAVTEMGLAIEEAPRDGDLRLLYGEILEADGRPRDALIAYEKAKRLLRRSDPRQQELTHRLALIEAVKLDEIEKAGQRLAELPENSARHLDLRGVIAIANGEPRQALLLYNQALQKKPDNDVSARILYHASLAYQQLGDEKNAYGTLYRAINIAENHGLVKDIEMLFKQLNARTPPR